MIRIITGPLGAGKTLYTVMDMFDALCRGVTVVTNIDVVWPEMVRLGARLKGVVLEDRQLVRVNPELNKNWESVIPWGEMGAFVEVYFDEIHLFYNSRDWQKTGTENRGLLSFLTQSRKAKVNVTFISQSKENVEKQFREMAEWELAVISTDHIPLGIDKYLPFKAFIVRVKDIQKGFVVRRHWKSYDRRFWKCYHSFSFLDSEMSALAVSANRVPRLRLKKVPFSRRLSMNISEPFRPFVSWLKSKRLLS